MARGVDVFLGRDRLARDGGDSPRCNTNVENLVETRLGVHHPPAIDRNVVCDLSAKGRGKQ